MRQINKIYVHCSATKPSQDIDATTIKKWHTDPDPEGRGWSDIGYHAVIKRDGTVEEGRPESKSGAHAMGHNSDSIGICLVGGINDKGDADANFTFEQYVALAALLKTKGDQYGITAENVFGHRDAANKDCPSFDIHAFIENSC